MDASHGGHAHMAESTMSLSIGRPIDQDDRVRQLKKDTSPGIRGMVWPYQSSSLTELQRKRDNGDMPPPKELCGLLSNHDTGSIFGLNGSQTSSGSIVPKGTDEECSPADLDLGLNGSEWRSGSFTSLLSGERSVLTSVDAGVSLHKNTCQKQGLWPKKVPAVSVEYGLTGAKTDVVAIKDNDAGVVPDLGAQLYLGLCRSSTTHIANTDYLSCAPGGQGRGIMYRETGSDAVFVGSIPVVDEGSTSARSGTAGGYIPTLLMGRNPEHLPFAQTSKDLEKPDGTKQCMFEVSNGGFGFGLVNGDNALDSDLFKGSRTTSGMASSCDRTSKTCKFRGCGKGARGASGLCITHGGGRRCQRAGCNKGAEGSTIYCKSHGGGRRCQNLGCTKSAEGKSDYCIAHGGGRRCSHDGCTKAARGRSGLCIRHGGGKRCQKEGCTKSAEGYSGFCISHGGGRRCQFEGCKKGAQGSTNFCKAHGGGKRCMIQGCNKGAEGSTPLCKGHGGGKRCMFDGGGICTKSVHGGTSFCVAHGGGKRCAIEGCTKSARGRTDFCVRHGGGKRCKVEGCTKSAQGSTDFCKAHGGGKRCCWGQDGSPYSEFVKDKTGDMFKGPCERFARGKLGLCAAHSALVQDCRVHGVGTIGNTLSSGIGPGLFRGLVEGSVHEGNQFDNTYKGSKLTIHGSTEHEDTLCGRSGPDSSMEAVDTQPVRDDVEGIPIVPMGFNPGVKFNNTSLAEEMPLSSEKREEGKVLISNFDTSNLWPGLSVPHQSNDNTPMNMGPPSSYNVLASQALQNDGLGTPSSSSSSSGPSLLAYQHPVLPPQVLVPLSMRVGGPFTPYQGPIGQYVGSSNYGASNVVSMCLPEQRVHCGNTLELLSWKKF